VSKGKNNAVVYNKGRVTYGVEGLFFPPRRETRVPVSSAQLAAIGAHPALEVRKVEEPKPAQTEKQGGAAVTKEA
jgi:hypothetical protein